MVRRKAWRYIEDYIEQSKYTRAATVRLLDTPTREILNVASFSYLLNMDLNLLFLNGSELNLQQACPRISDESGLRSEVHIDRALVCMTAR